MASKNSRKIYVKNSYYHVYNRGVEKRTIFTDKQDYKVFLNYLRQYLSPPPDKEKLTIEFTLSDQVFKGIPRQLKNYHEKIDLAAFCLMPNHFHLLIKQSDPSSMKDFVHSLLLRYTKYFNTKHNRVGRLYQGRYKAVRVDSDEYLMHLSKYIHTNPLDYTNNIIDAYSSYSDYLGLTNTNWVSTKTILSFFNSSVIKGLKKVNNYKDFVESNIDSISVLGDTAIDD